MKQYNSGYDMMRDDVDGTYNEVCDGTAVTGTARYFTWGDEQYTFPNQIGAIKRAYRYLVGNGTGLAGFIKKLEAIPGARSKSTGPDNRVLYDSAAVFELFKTYNTTSLILERRKINSLEELVFRMEESEC